VYDVHLRGMDNITRYGAAVANLNKITLVMIDDRPIFNHINGGVFWEALPISMHDVERIEIIKGPSSALFGPNAVTGTINIVTKKLDNSGFSTNGNIQYGSFNTIVGGVSAGIKSGKFNAILSGNVDMRDRYTSKYYEYVGQRFVDSHYELINASGRPLTDPDIEYPTPSKAVGRYGFNAFLSYNIADDITIGLDAGMQDTERQAYLFTSGHTPLSFASLKSEYVNFTTKFKGLKVRYSYTQGDDALIYSVLSKDAGSYSYVLNEVFIDYIWSINSKLSLQPGFNYQHANYSKYDPVKTTAGSLRLDYYPLDNWRLIAAVRLDKFSIPDDTYISYQFASTYKINENNLVRAVVSRSNSGAFLGSTLLDIEFEFPIQGLPLPGMVSFKGNPELRLFSLDLIEAGYRTRLSQNVDLNFDFYSQTGTNFFSQINHVIPQGYLSFVSTNVKLENLETVSRQNGVSVSVNYVTNSKL